MVRVPSRPSRMGSWARLHCLAVAGLAEQRQAGRQRQRRQRARRGGFAQNQSRADHGAGLATVVWGSRFHPWKGLPETEARAGISRAQAAATVPSRLASATGLDDSLTPVRACLTGEGSRQAFLQAMGDAGLRRPICGRPDQGRAGSCTTYSRTSKASIQWEW